MRKTAASRTTAPSRVLLIALLLTGKATRPVKLNTADLSQAEVATVTTEA